MIKTVDGTATSPKKFEAKMENVKMNKSQNEHSFKIQIVDDDEYNPDLDFYVELCSEDGKRLEGDDT